MKTGIFASSYFGVFVMEYFIKNNKKLEFVAVDNNDFHNCNDKILDLAKSQNYKVIFSDSLYTDSTLRYMQHVNPDLIILGWWPYIIKSPLLEIPRIGYLNTHPSFLPFGRGKFSNFWSIVEGTPYGVSMQLIDKGIDTGNVICQQKIEKSWEDTGKTLYEKAIQLSKEIFIQNIESILSENFTTYAQDNSKATNHLSYEIDKASEINLEQSYKAKDLLNIIRARTFKPHPGAYFYDDGVKYEVRIEINKSN